MDTSFVQLLLVVSTRKRQESRAAKAQLIDVVERKGVKPIGVWHRVATESMHALLVILFVSGVCARCQFV